jgi:hypothetical protein
MQTLRERLIGTWRLVSYLVQREDGSVTYPMGRDVTGIILYTTDGYMSASLMQSGRRLLSGGNATSATPEELAAAAASYFSYCARFAVDEAMQLVTHQIDLALTPNMVGSTQRRHVRLAGKQLELRGDPVPATGGATVPVITWERAEELKA